MELGKPVPEGKPSTSRLDAATKAVSFNVLLQVMISPNRLLVCVLSISCISQLLLRVSSFTLNGIILRYVKPKLLGVVNLR